MGFSEKGIEVFQQNELKPEDTFCFDCKMCGGCCRNRSEPILMTGADIYRIARSLGMTMMDTVAEKTNGYIGDTSHIPVLVLRERMDGSCSLLRKGRCMVHHDKPAVCALFPLGRFYNFQDKEFHYFMNPNTCQTGKTDGKIWTLQEWLDEFKIEETEYMTEAWNRLIGGITAVTIKMDKSKIKGTLLEVLLSALYLDYDTNIPYVEQVESHMEKLKVFFKQTLHKNINFDIV